MIGCDPAIFGIRDNTLDTEHRLLWLKSASKNCPCGQFDYAPSAMHFATIFAAQNFLDDMIIGQFSDGSRQMYASDVRCIVTKFEACQIPRDELLPLEES
jgi:hypothetical protein